MRVYEAAWILRASEREVRNRLRRGSRLIHRGASEEEVIAAGALVPSMAGRRRRVALEPLQEAVRDDSLAREALRRLIGGEVAAPPAESPDEPAPSLIGVLDQI